MKSSFPLSYKGRGGTYLAAQVPCPSCDVTLYVVLMTTTEEGSVEMRAALSDEQGDVDLLAAVLLRPQGAEGLVKFGVSTVDLLAELPRDGCNDLRSNVVNKKSGIEICQFARHRVSD